MQKLVTVLQMIARVLGVLQIVVGIAMWLGWARGATAFHTGAGSLFVLVVWIIALIALFALSKRGVALFTLLWGGAVLWFGMAQTAFLPGSLHWAVRLVHLLVGLALLGLAERLGKAVRVHEVAKALS